MNECELSPLVGHLIHNPAARIQYQLQMYRKIVLNYCILFAEKIMFRYVCVTQEVIVCVTQEVIVLAMHFEAS